MEGSLSKFKHISGRQSGVDFLKQYGLLIVLIIILVLQIERVIRKGTFLGFEVRSVKTAQVKRLQSQSGSFLDANVSKENQKSASCESFPQAKVSQVLGVDVERVSGFIPDRTEPIKTSSCLYRTKVDKADATTISFLIRELKDEAVAKKNLEGLRQKSGETIKKLGDDAYFNTSTNQLTVRQGKKLTTITAPGKFSKKDNKTVTVELARISIK